MIMLAKIILIPNNDKTSINLCGKLIDKHFNFQENSALQLFFTHNCIMSNSFLQSKIIAGVSSLTFCWTLFSSQAISPVDALPSLVKNYKNRCNKGRGAFNNDCPQAAIVLELNWKNETDRSLKKIAFLGLSNITPVSNGNIFFDNKQLYIAGAKQENKRVGATIRFVKNKNDPNSWIKEFYSLAGFSQYSTIYKYPCTINGSFTIGWEIKKGSGCNFIYSPALSESRNFSKRASSSQMKYISYLADEALRNLANPYRMKNRYNNSGSPLMSYLFLQEIERDSGLFHSKDLASEFDQLDQISSIEGVNPKPGPFHKNEEFLKGIQVDDRGQLERQKLSKISDTFLSDSIQNLDQGARVNYRQYCSVISSSGKDWAIKIASKAEAEPEDLCDRVTSECEIKAKETCSIANQGSWRAYPPNFKLHKVRVLLECLDSDPYDQMVRGYEVTDNWIEEIKKRFGNNSACVLSIHNPDDVFIDPDPEQRTLIHTDEINGQLQVTVLAGKVIISQPRFSEQDSNTSGASTSAKKNEINAGERYVLNLENLDSTTQILNSGQITAVQNLPVVQAFLNPSNWEYPDEWKAGDPNIKEKIRAFEEAVKRLTANQNSGPSSSRDLQASESVPFLLETPTGDTMTIILPAGYDKTRIYPTLILLPYSSNLTDYYSRSFFQQYSKRTDNAFVIISFDAKEKSKIGDPYWNGNLQNNNSLCRKIKTYDLWINDLDNLLNRFMPESKVKIDKSRLALGGSSLGGDLSWALSLRNPKLIRGTVIINSESSYRLNTCGDETLTLEESMRQLADKKARFAMFLGSYTVKTQPNKKQIQAAIELLNKYGLEPRYIPVSTGNQEEDRRLRTDRMMESVDYVLFGK
jgi:hypothetical protein